MIEKIEVKENPDWVLVYGAKNGANRTPMTLQFGHL